MELPKKIIFEEDKEIFDELVKEILSILGDDVVKIILYGSVARGDNTWESDVDIAVLTKKFYDWEAQRELFEKLWEYDMKYCRIFSVLPIQADSFDALKKARLFYRNILKDGIVLWTKGAA